MSSRQRRQRCPSLSAWRNVLPLFFANEALPPRDTARRIFGAASGANKRVHLTAPGTCAYRVSGDLVAEDHQEAGDQELHIGLRTGKADGHDPSCNVGRHRGFLAADVMEQIHQEQAGARNRQRHAEGVGERLGDREPLRIHHVGEPRAKADPDPKERAKAEHARDHSYRELAEHHHERIALGVASGVGREWLLRPRKPHVLEDIERLVAFAVRGEPARRFWKTEAEQEDNERTDSDDYPDSAPAKRVAKQQRKEKRDWPHQCAAEEMDDGQDAAANGLWCVFPSIGPAEWLLRAKSDAGDETTHRKQGEVGCERAENREDPEEQKIELIDRPAPQPVAELALSERADEEANERCASDPTGLGRGCEL